jgi:hypothetical protein
MGAFDNFNPPSTSSKGGAFDNFQPPATPDLGTTAIWNKPADTSWSDFMLAHLAKPFQGANQAAQDYSRAAVDAATFGLGDRFQSYLTGNPLDQERAQTAAASSRLGAMAPIVSGAMYAVGPGELGAASKIGEAVAPAIGKWAGGVLGSGVEGALAGGAGAAGHDENIGQGALLGGALGAAGGVPGGVVGRGGTLAPPVSADDLHAAASQIYKPLDNIIFDAKSEVHPELDAFKQTIGNTTDLTDKRLKQATGTSAILGDLYDSPQLTGRNIQEAQRSLDKIANAPSSSVQDQEYAPKLKTALQNVMDNGLPFAGVPAGNQASGYAGLVQRAGDLIHGRAEDVDTLDTMIQKSQSGNKPDIGAQMGAYMNSKSGMGFIKPGTPQYDAANTLSATAQAPLTSGQGLTMWDLKHHLMWPAIGLGGAGAASLIGTEEGHQPAWAQIPEDIAGLGAGFALKRGLGAAGALAQQRALAAARTAFSTGQAQAPVLPEAPFRDAVRRLIFGQGAAGQN